MVQIRDLSISFQGAPLFEDVQCIITPGDKVGLIGRNGCGKSTFLKILMGQLEPDSGTIALPKSYHIGYLQQHLHFQHDTVIDEVSSILPEDRCYETWKAEKILMGLGFSVDDMLSHPKDFSGGFQVKINLAKVLLQEPSLLLLDEPTNYLDIHSSKWLKSFLQNWQQELILITHDRMFMDSIISHTLYMHRGTLRKTAGTTDKIYQQVAEEEAIREQTRINQEKNRQKTQDWIDRFKAKSHTASRAKSKIKMLAKEETIAKMQIIEELAFCFPFTPFSSREYQIQTKNLSFGYHPDQLLIQNLSFEVNFGDKICVVGKNGKGKSTLLRLLAGDLTPLSGKMAQHSKVVAGYFGQTNIQRLNPKYTILEQLAHSNANANDQAIRQVCATMLFSSDKAKKTISVLSGGEKSRVMLGQLLLSPKNLLLLDEPTNHLDMESAEALMEAIDQFKGSVIMVSHDEVYLKKIATKLIVYDDDKVYFYPKTYQAFLKEHGWRDT